MGYTAAAIAIAGTTHAVVSGERANRNQKRAVRAQEEAQGKAEAEAVSQQRQAEEAIRRQNAKKPNIAALLEGARKGQGGLGTTFLTGARGVDPDDLRLGGNTLLGG